MASFCSFCSLFASFLRDFFIEIWQTQLTIFTTMKLKSRMAIKIVIKALAHSASAITLVICSNKCVMVIL